MSQEQADKRCDVPNHEHRHQDNRLVPVPDAQHEDDRGYRADDCRHQSDGAESAPFVIGIEQRGIRQVFILAAVTAERGAIQ